MLAALRIRAFRSLVVSDVVSLLSYYINLIALPFLAYEVTGSAVALGGVLAAAALPKAVVALVGGSMADRLPPRAIMLASTLGSVAILTVTAIVAAVGATTWWSVAAAAVLLGVVDAVFDPVADAVRPRLVPDEQLDGATAVDGVVTDSTGLIAPAAAGILIGTLGPTAALVTSAALSLLALVPLLRVPALPGLAGDGRRLGPLTVLRDTRAGLSTVLRLPVVRGFLLTVVIAALAFDGPMTVGGLAFAVERLGGPVAFGWLLAAFSAGNLLGTTLAGLRPLRLRPVALAVLWAAPLGVALMAIALVPSLPVILGVAVVTGTVSNWADTALWTATVRTIPREQRGRVMGLFSFAFYGVEPLAYVLAGGLAFAGTAVVLLGGGVVLVVTSALVALDRGFRRAANPHRRAAPGPETDAPGPADPPGPPSGAPRGDVGSPDTGLVPAAG